MSILFDVNVFILNTVYCGSVDNFPHGEVRIVDGTTYGATMYFVCVDNYVLVGEHKTTCTSEGQWFSIPECYDTCELVTITININKQLRYPWLGSTIHFV